MARSRVQGLLGVRVGDASLDVLLDEAMAAVSNRTTPFTFACANPHSLVVAEHDKEFRAALSACTAVVADGVGVSLAGRLVGASVGPRITGIDFFLGVMRRLNARGGRVFFFGSSEEVLDRILCRARHEFPNLHIESFSPPFGEWDETTNAEMVERIRDAQPDALWVGMTAPRQEKWAMSNSHRCGVPVVGSIGAVFDYYAETVKRAPEWLCKAGLEWLYRLLHEPRRLWRRTLLSAPKFLWLVFRRHVIAKHKLSRV